MGIFKNKGTSEAIQKGVAKLKGQLKNMEGQLGPKEDKIEAAMIAGDDVSKLFDECGTLRGSIESRKVILARMEQEYARALQREGAAVKRAELSRFEKALEKDVADLENLLEVFATAAIDLVRMEGDFEQQYRELLQIPGPAGVDFGMLPRPDSGFILNAISVRLPANSPRTAIEGAKRDAMSNLHSIRATMQNRVAKARSTLDVVTAPAVAEPITPVAPKKQVVNGGKELYHEQRQEALKKLKAKGETKSDVETRDAVAEMDREADAGRKRQYSDFPSGY